MAVGVLASARPGASRDASARAYRFLLPCVAVAAALRLVAGSHPAVAAAELGFVSLFVESLPFLLVGALLSNVLLLSPGQRILTAAARRPRLAGALAPFAGLALPLCDCGLLPLARRLEAAGPARAVNAFLAGAPLANPIVIVTTWLAFPNEPGIVLARVLCGFAVAAVAGAVAAAPSHRCDGPDHEHEHPDSGSSRSWSAAVAGELSRSAPTLVVGAALAAALKAAIPVATLSSAGRQPLLGAVAMMALAFVMSICSQADAFVAASIPVGPLPQLGFMVLGPVLDLRLAVLYRREFGTRWLLSYAAVVVPVTLVAVTVCATTGLL